MPVQNTEIAAALTKLADLLEIEGENPFKIRAYRNAARTVQGLSRGLADMIKKGEDLRELPGVGEAIAKKIAEMVETGGHLTALEKEERKLPPTLSDLLKVPGLGPRRVHTLFETLKIADREDLARAAKSGRLRELPGFGAATEAKILAHLDAQQQTAGRHLLPAAEQIVTPLLEHLRGARGVGRLIAAGSFRRRQETVGDVDILASGAEHGPIMERFVGYEDATEVLARGETRSSVLLRSGLQVDLRVVDEESYGAALHYFTGSKAHNIAVRARAVKAGLKLNEYGVFRGDARVAGRTEEEVFASVGLPWIAPELREDRGEIDAAGEGRLPRLVDVADIRGDLQSHTTATDGQAGLVAMARAAQARGYGYLAVTDHSKRVAMAHGLNATRLRQQIREIDKLNPDFEGFRILKSIEVDIMEDGSLDLSDDVLKDLDLVVASVHYGLNASREKQTERVIRAMDNPLVSIIAHPTGRLIGEREPMDLDMERLIRAAAERGCALEINAQPSRLDLNDLHARMVKEAGGRVVISTDAHSINDLAWMPYGVGQARRGWIEPADVLNTLPWPELQKRLRR